MSSPPWALTSAHVPVRRRVAALLVGGLTLLAAIGPGATVGFAASVEPSHPEGNPTCTELGYSRAFKIDTGNLVARTYVWNEEQPTPVQSVWTGQEITITDLSADGQTFSFSALLPVYAVIVKAGNTNNAVYEYSPPVLSDTDLTRGEGQNDISHVTFCGQSHPSASPSAPPSSAPPSSAPPSEPPSTPPSEPPSTPPSAPPSTPPSAPPSTPPSVPPSSAPPSEPPPGEALVAVLKLFDLDGSLATTDDQTPVGDWEFGVSVVGGTSSDDVVVTDEEGLAAFIVSIDDATATVTVTEVLDEDMQLLDVTCEVLDLGEIEIDALRDGGLSTAAVEEGVAFDVEPDTVYGCLFINAGSGEVGGATGTPAPTGDEAPAITLPPTDVVGGTTQDVPAFGRVLVVIAGLLLTMGLLLPTRVARRR